MKAKNIIPIFIFLLLATSTAFADSCPYGTENKLFASTRDRGKIFVLNELWEVTYDSTEQIIWTLGDYSLNNHIYAGTYSNGLIYEYDGCEWSLSFDSPEDDIKSIKEYDGKLYASAGSYSGVAGRIYVYDGSTWNLAFTPPDYDDRYGYSLEVYDGKLYYGTGFDKGTIYVFNGSTWSKLYDTNTDGVFALKAFNGHLYAGTIKPGKIFRFNGTSWVLDEEISGAFAINGLEVYDGDIYATTSDGEIYKRNGPTWDFVYDTGESSAIGMEVHEGKLYVGSGTNGKIFVYNGTSWELDYDSPENRVYTLLSACVQSCDYCGDGICSEGEDEWTCCQDCGIPDPTCDGTEKVWYECSYEPGDECPTSICPPTELRLDCDIYDTSSCLDDHTIGMDDYFCDYETADCDYAETQITCDSEGWEGGGDNPFGFSNDPSCEYSESFCLDNGIVYCTPQSVTYTVDYDYLDTEFCDGSFLTQADYWCDLATCDSSDPANGCDPGNQNYTLGCDFQCEAGCEDDMDCPDDSCSENYWDYCNQSNSQLVEHHGIINDIIDYVTVTDSVVNTCDGEICECSEDEASCLEPETISHCVEDLCGATCDEDSDCDYELIEDTCYYDGFCLTDGDCACDYDSTCSVESYCDDNIWNYDGDCGLGGCDFDQQPCSDLDYSTSYLICDGSVVVNRTEYHSHLCVEQYGCNETLTIIDDLLEDCDAYDEQLHNECGVEDWTCSAGSCVLDDIVPEDEMCPDFCGGLEMRNYNGHCNPSTFLCVYDHEDCDNHDGEYCTQDLEGLMTRDYYCNDTTVSCEYTSSIEDCGPEGWSGGGDILSWNDPACEYTDYWCVDRTGGIDYCTSGKITTVDYDYLDSTYCEDPFSVGDDYYCDPENCNNSDSSVLGCEPPGLDSASYCDETCGAECDEDLDCGYYEDPQTDTCYYDGVCLTDLDCTCDYLNCSLGSYCVENTWYHDADCTGTGCEFEQETCPEDYTEEFLECEGSFVLNHTVIHEFRCDDEAGCVDDETHLYNPVENCDDYDGQLSEECGYEDWTCSAGSCVMDDIVPEDEMCPDFCGGLEMRYYNGHCNPSTFLCVYDHEDCDNYDGDYCTQDFEGLEMTDYFCNDTTVTCDSSYSVVDCGPEGWSGGGNVFGWNDPACEYTDYWCVDGSGGSDYCDSGMITEVDYDYLDSVYCENPFNVEDDYYCNPASCDDGDSSIYGCEPPGLDSDSYCDETCGAECDEDSDCESHVDGSTCYYYSAGGPSCDGEECACEFNTCELEEGYYCDPMEGCVPGCVEDSDCDYLEYYYDVFDCETSEVWRNRTYFQHFRCNVNNDCVEGLTDLVELETFDCDNFYEPVGECGKQISSCVPTPAMCENETITIDYYCGPDGYFCLDDNTVGFVYNYCDPFTFMCEEDPVVEDVCDGDGWIGGGDAMPEIGSPPWDDPACTYTNETCVEPFYGYAYCEQEPGLYPNDFDNLDNYICVDGYNASEDHWCELETCDSGNPANGCSDGSKYFDFVCDEECGAECDEDSDCEPYVDGGVCYYNSDGTPTCDLGQCACDYDYCELEEGEICHPIDGCISQECIEDSDCEYLEHASELYECAEDEWRNTTFWNEYICNLTTHTCESDGQTPLDTETFDCSQYDTTVGECGEQTGYCVESELMCDVSTAQVDGMCPDDSTFCIDNSTVGLLDYYCNMTYYCDYTESVVDECQSGLWVGGGDTPNGDPWDNITEWDETWDMYGFWDDPACTYGGEVCQEDGVAECVFVFGQYDEDFDPYDTVDACVGNYSAYLDYWCELENCVNENPELGCIPPASTSLVLECSMYCGAECGNDGDCPADVCAEIYWDYCDLESNKIVEHDGIVNDILDSVLVEDSAENFCDEECFCSDNGASCLEPETISHCVEGLCGAECDNNADCSAYLDPIAELCYFDGACDGICECDYDSEYCDPGHVEEGVCYYQDLVYDDVCDEDGCHLTTCLLEENQICDSELGCIWEDCTPQDECDEDADCDGNDGFYCEGDDIVYQDWYCQMFGICSCDYTQTYIGTCRSDAYDTDNPSGTTPLDPDQFMAPGTCTDYGGCLDAQCLSTDSKDYCDESIEGRLVEYYVDGDLCDSTIKDCNDYDEEEADLALGNCEWYDYGCAGSVDGGACAAANFHVTNCIDSDAIATAPTDTCEWWKQNVTEESCEIGCYDEECCEITDDYLVDCDDYDVMGLFHTLSDWEVTQVSCTVGCEGESCCEETNYTCDERCEAVLVEGVPYWCTEEGTWVTEIPVYCTPECLDDDDAPNIYEDSMVDDGIITDDNQDPYTMCVNIFDADGCGIYEVEFKTHFFCQDVTIWEDYTYMQELGTNYYKYCYELPREVWIDWVNRELSWKVRATDYFNNTAESPWDEGGSIVYDDDTDGPMVENFDYADRESTGWFTQFNESMPASADVTDPSGLASVGLNYIVYDYYTPDVIELEGNLPPVSVSGDHYEFEVPALCSGTDKGTCEYANKYMKLTVVATDGDNDGWSGDNATSHTVSQLIYIDPPGDEIPQDPNAGKPYITSYFPADAELSVEEGNCLIFGVTAEDLDGDTLSYKWKVDDVQVGIGESYEYCPENYQAGMHEVKVSVSDGISKAEHAWDIAVMNFVCDDEKAVEEDGESDGGSNDGGTGEGLGGLGFSGFESLKSLFAPTTTTTPATDDVTGREIPGGNVTIPLFEGGKEEVEEGLPFTGLVSAVNPVAIIISFGITLFVLLILLRWVAMRQK